MTCIVILFDVAIVYADCVVVAFQKSISFKPVFADHTRLSSSGSSSFSCLGDLPLHPSTGQGMGSFGFDSSLSPMCSGLKAESLFRRSPSPPSGSGSASSGASSGTAKIASFAQQSHQIEAHRRAVWDAFWRRVFSARNVFLSDVAYLDRQAASILFHMDPSITV